MTRRDEEDQTPRRPGGHAAERRRQFEQQRGLSDPRELPDDELPEEDSNAPAQPDQGASPDCEHD
jgi:hypothetical protein